MSIKLYVSKDIPLNGIIRMNSDGSVHSNPYNLEFLEYIVSIIYFNRVANAKFKGMNNPYIYINSKILKSIVSFYEEYIRILISTGIIEVNPAGFFCNRTGMKDKKTGLLLRSYSKSYRLTEKYKNAKFRLSDKPCSLNIPEKEVLEYQKRQRELLKSVTIDKEEASKLISEYYDANDPEILEILQRYEDIVDFGLASKPSFLKKMINRGKNSLNSLMFNLESLVRGNIFTAVSSKTGRLFTNMTSLNRIMRRAVRLNGERVANVDIKSCQPALMSRLYNGLTDEAAILEAEKYKTLIKEGRFYEFFIEHLPSIFKNRNEVKAPLYVVWFGKYIAGWQKQAVALREVFQREFPILWNQIVLFKREDHSKMAIQLQRWESDFMFKVLSPVLEAKDFAILTIHDAIMCGLEQACKVKAIMEDLFSKYLGFKCRCSIDAFANS